MTMSSVPWLASPKSRRCTLVLISFVRDTQLGMLCWSWFSQMRMDLSWDWFVMDNPKGLANRWGFGGRQQIFESGFPFNQLHWKHMEFTSLFGKQALRWSVTMRILTPLWKGYTRRLMELKRQFFPNSQPNGSSKERVGYMTVLVMEN